MTQERFQTFVATSAKRLQDESRLDGLNMLLACGQSHFKAGLQVSFQVLQLCWCRSSFLHLFLAQDDREDRCLARWQVKLPGVTDWHSHRLMETKQAFLSGQQTRNL